MRTMNLWLGIVLFFVVDNLPIYPDETVAHMAAVSALMVTWWITEAIPLAATALAPLVLFPLLGITSGREIAGVYMSSTIFLFIGGFILALAMQRWNLHQRIAMRIIGWFHGSADMMLLGFMLTAAFLSMWISNTASATMLLPIGMAVYTRCGASLDEDAQQRLLTALMLGIAYACSIGGASTLIGTPPNMAFQNIYSITFPDKDVITFAQWVLFALPVSMVMLTACWFIIRHRYTHNQLAELRLSDHIESTSGPMTYEEKAVATVFTSTALAWIFRQDIVIGQLVIPGWSGFLAHPENIDDGTIAIASALLLFLLPSRDRTRYSTLVDIDTIADIPWKIVLLFGGGFALAKGFTTSGLSEYIGQQLISLRDLDTVTIIAGLSSLVVFLTEVTSNTATAQMMLPLVASIADAVGTEPVLLMIPITLSASMAFMMPVATPPNAIVFASGKLRIRDMVTTGFILNIIAIGVITIACTFWAPMVFAP